MGEPRTWPEIMAESITVWPFRQAPAAWRELHTGQGDGAEWVAFVPDSMEAPDWIVFGTQFDRRSMAEMHPVDGGQVWIGSHA